MSGVSTGFLGISMDWVGSEPSSVSAMVKETPGGVI